MNSAGVVQWERQQKKWPRRCANSPRPGTKGRSASVHLDDSHPNETAVKRCIRCGTVKPQTEFFRLAKSTKLRGHCKDCHNRGRSKWVATPWYSRIHTLRNVTYKLGGGAKTPTIHELRTVVGEPTTCWLCGGSVTWETGTLDHVIPVSRGGQNTATNIKWAHGHCNRFKSGLLLEELLILAWPIIAYWDSIRDTAGTPP